MALLVLAYILVTRWCRRRGSSSAFMSAAFANNINRRMKGILYASLVRQSRASLEKEGAGELMTKAISDVDDCVEGMRKFTTEVFDTGVALAGYVVMLLVYDWRLALLSLLFTPFSYVCAAWMKKPVQRAGAAYKKAAGRTECRHLRPRPERRDLPHLRLRRRPCGAVRRGAGYLRKDDGEKTMCGSRLCRRSIWRRRRQAYCSFCGSGAKNVLGTGWRVWDIAAFTTFLSCFTKLVVKSSKVASSSTRCRRPKSHGSASNL